MSDKHDLPFFWHFEVTKCFLLEKTSLSISFHIRVAIQVEKYIFIYFNPLNTGGAGGGWSYFQRWLYNKLSSGSDKPQLRWHLNFFALRIFLPKNFLDPKIFLPKIFLSQNFWLTQKYFVALKIFWPQKFFGPKNFLTQKIFDPKIF